MEEVTIFCDGSCLGNPGPGGWAALLVVEKGGERHEHLVSGGTARTTNQKMELVAATEALRRLKRPCRVTVFTDSQYVIKGMTAWRHGWEKNGWRNAQKKPVENQVLWQSLIAAASPHEVSWRWVRGHSGHPENERVDQAARVEATRFARS